jgi:hypothetical protein
VIADGSASEHTSAHASRINPSSSAGAKPCSERTGASSGQQSAVRDEQRRTDGQRRLRHFSARASRVPAWARRERDGQRSRHSRSRDASERFTCAERRAARRSRNALTAISGSKLLRGARSRRRRIRVTATGRHDAAHHLAIVLSARRSRARQEQHECCQQGENLSSNGAHRCLAYSIHCWSRAKPRAGAAFGGSVLKCAWFSGGALCRRRLCRP